MRIFSTPIGAALAASALLAGAAAAKVGPHPVVATADGVWAAASGGTVVRIDPQDGRVLARTGRLGFPYALAAGRGRAWVVDGRLRLLRLTPSGAIAARTTLRGFPGELAAGERSLWVVVHAGRRTGTVLLRIDHDSLHVRGRFHLGPRAAFVAAGDGRVWLGLDPASPRGRAAALLALDEQDGEVLLRRRLRGAVRGLAVSRDGVWVVTQRGRGARMVQLDRGTGTRIRAITVPANPGRLAAGGGRVWLSTLCGGPSCRIDRASVRGWAAATGRLVAGPFSTWTACRRGASRSLQLFLSSVAATPGGAVATVGEDRGGVRVALVSERDGILGCPRL